MSPNSVWMGWSIELSTSLDVRPGYIWQGFNHYNNPTISVLCFSIFFHRCQNLRNAIIFITTTFKKEWLIFSLNVCEAPSDNRLKSLCSNIHICCRIVVWSLHHVWSISVRSIWPVITALRPVSYVFFFLVIASLFHMVGT